jgi:CRISPR-associated protein Cas1
MSWRSVIITQPSYLKLSNSAMLVVQDSEAVSIPLEDISVLVIDNPRVKLSGQLLSACATWQIAVITVGFDHHPNGVLMPYLPHSRALQVMQRQIAIKRPLAKQLWQTIIQQKIANQAAALLTVSQQQPARILRALLAEVKSGDSGNVESLASQKYFKKMFGKGVNRRVKNQVN